MSEARHHPVQLSFVIPVYNGADSIGRVVEEIHRLYGMETGKSRRWCREGRWRARMIDGQWFVSAADVERTFDFSSDRVSELSLRGQAALERAMGSIGGSGYRA